MEDLIPPQEQPSEPVEEPEPPADSLPEASADFSEPMPPVPAEFTEPEVPAEEDASPLVDAGPALTEDSPEEIVCPQCGSEVNPGARFCGTCGKRLDE